ncbi:MAG: sodium:solute symporter [Bacteroidia bacterium]|nr:sodium:solute symporter [Bacteroidia bacterium]
MSWIDWMVLGATTFFIVAYGIWKSWGASNLSDYVLANKSMKWWTIGLSIMATQASAITFLSTPGQGYDDGMGFVQFYFGLPIAAVVLSIVAIPLYHRLKVFTAYEFLEKRFDLKTRGVAAILFLIQRGLAAGFTIYAPALILSTVLPWDTTWACVLIGVVVTTYTVLGGTQAVSQTQKLQMGVILAGMVIAGVMLVLKLPENISFSNALGIAGKMGKMEVIDFNFDLENRYNVWSGILAGTFLMLSYFGTDQSQVQRYLGGKSITESRMGLLLNGLVKVPMQFLILLVGVLLFVFYQFERPPINFNKTSTTIVQNSQYADTYKQLENTYAAIHARQRDALQAWDEALDNNDQAAVEQKQAEAQSLDENLSEVREKAKILIAKAEMLNAGESITKYEEAEAYILESQLANSVDSLQLKEAESNIQELKDNLKRDSDRIFLTFILDHLPVGVVGLLIAMILAASMSSTSSELNALGTTSVVDIYKRMLVKDKDDNHYLNASKGLTIMWGVYAIGFSLFADQLENLIQAVNILGSLVYGTILGIFMVAFFMKRIQGTAVFYAAILAECIILYMYFFQPKALAFLWYTPLGCFTVMIFAYIFQTFLPRAEVKELDDI